MKSIRPLSLAAFVALIAACGGGSDQQYSTLVSFGDSLSDVGSYSVSTIATVGGGKYTVNGSGNLIWVELLAARVGTAAPESRIRSARTTRRSVSSGRSPIRSSTRSIGISPRWEASSGAMSSSPCWRAATMSS